MSFKTTTKKLTSFYLLIIMAISMFFSINLYLISVQEINQSFIRQTQLLQQIPRFRSLADDPDFIEMRIDRLREAKAKIIIQLFLTNAIILVSGGVLSYWFAKRTLKPIQESHEAQRRFTADASHELRTPITAMRTEIEVALRDKKLTIDESKNLLKSNLEELSKLNSLIEALLRLARLGEEDLKWGMINIQDFVVPAVDRVKNLANNRDIKLQVSEVDGKVNGDKGALVELLVTILDNAIKYTPEGKSVKVNVISSDKQRVVEVVDDGPGIDPIEQSKIFERFYRSDNSRNKDKVDGYGLGLSIARQIAELHNASLTVQSEVGKGATFKLSLPVV